LPFDNYITVKIATGRDSLAKWLLAAGDARMAGLEGWLGCGLQALSLLPDKRGRSLRQRLLEMFTTHRAIHNEPYPILKAIEAI